MTKVLLATNNPGKAAEIKSILEGIGAILVTPAEIGLTMEVEEDGSSYGQNAAIKARAFCEASGLITLADDSGLEVYALNGQPGIHSARFSPIPGATDADRRQYLLERLREKPHPWRARFRCAIAIVAPGRPVTFTEGVCPGEVISEERGENGFGYDPIFLLSEIGKTMAQLSMEEKNRLSHRGRAVHAAIPILTAML